MEKGSIQGGVDSPRLRVSDKIGSRGLLSVLQGAMKRGGQRESEGIRGSG